MERTHRTLWGIIRAIRVIGDVTTWKTAVQEATYQYNSTPHQSTGYSPNLLHHGYDKVSPGLLHPEGVPANPPLTTQEHRIKFKKQVEQIQTLILDIVMKNQNEAHPRAAKSYLMRTLQLPVNSWFWVYNPCAFRQTETS